MAYIVMAYRTILRTAGLAEMWRHISYGNILVMAYIVMAYRTILRIAGLAEMWRQKPEDGLVTRVQTRVDMWNDTWQQRASATRARPSGWGMCRSILHGHVYRHMYRHVHMYRHLCMFRHLYRDVQGMSNGK